MKTKPKLSKKQLHRNRIIYASFMASAAASLIVALVTQPTISRSDIFLIVISVIAAFAGLAVMIFKNMGKTYLKQYLFDVTLSILAGFFAWLLFIYKGNMFLFMLAIVVAVGSYLFLLWFYKKVRTD